MNDLSAFDLNKLQLPNNRWEMLMENSESAARVPPARTNHSIITFNDKMYLYVLPVSLSPFPSRLPCVKLAEGLRIPADDFRQLWRNEWLPMVQ